MDYYDDVLKLLTYIFQVHMLFHSILHIDYIFQVHMLFHSILLVKTQNMRVAKKQGE